MLELLFVIGFFVMLLVTGVSLLGIIAAIVVATALMFVGGLFALMIKLLGAAQPEQFCRQPRRHCCANLSLLAR